jgi:hypothetical protein
LDSIFNKDAAIPTVPATGNGDATPAAAPPAANPIPLSPAAQKFVSCRWRKPAEDGNPDHCTHRDVLPMAGMTGFVPDSWCSDCSFFKAKRSPRKRQEEERPDWRW